ncbi:origin recognition complex subunit, putative [Pediculus humanus corporis]|uniref:Origin recognition complex subunit 3 n=1 Tax=Pediculus humanus subsp. corporis TaxID=121224 RepID=E0VX57_PEDHC|nr:origin recognition complex subunit, putative [Pediculus humanus corporis]EEB17963.1 origin recognition complex subunit, putative [Pediculus humanus corporis]
MQTSSISQGSFIFTPKNFDLSKTRKKRKRSSSKETKDNWEEAFDNVWNTVYKEIKEVNESLFKNILEDIIKHIKNIDSKNENDKLEHGILPCEILITGTNLPDHNLLVSALCDDMKKVTPYISVLWSVNCGNIKNTISTLAQQIISTDTIKKHDINNCEAEDENLNDDKNDGSEISLQSSQYNLSTLTAWYVYQSKNLKSNPPVVIFLPDFESFSSKVLSEFIPLLSSYSSQTPFILIFGVATTPGAVYQSLNHSVLSLLSVQIFKSESSMCFLNQIIEKILFSTKCPFRLSSRCMTFLIDIFLFHSFSVQGFIQGFKFCMMEHFYDKSHFTLCCSPENLEKNVEKLSDQDVENMRRIPSFQRFVEKSTKEDRHLLLLNNEHSKKVIKNMIKDVQEHISNFHVALKCLYILTQDLPQYPLGRHLREYYCQAISKDIKECVEYKECIKALSFQTKKELWTKISLIIDFLKLNSLIDILTSDNVTKFEEIVKQLENFKDKFNENSNAAEDSSDFESTRKSFLDYVEENVLLKMLSPVNLLPLHEIILFDDLPSIRRRISGSPRGAVHLALNNPHYYLDCKCCVLPQPELVLPTLPDLSIVYKLHLEFGKIINLYDWLQAFAACIKPESSETETDVDDVIQARFIRAVSELQFLGFIKPSRSKSDHVHRLTWGNI